MQLKDSFLRILFGLNLLFFVYCMFSPWAFNGGNKYYWSFQEVSHPRGFQTNLLFEWELWFNPDSRVTFLDYWFSQEMYYYGFTYEWIRIFIFQSLTVLSSVWILSRKWRKTSLMLIPFFLSLYGEFLGWLLVGRYLSFPNYPFIHGYPAWGLPFAMFSTLFLLLLFLLRYGLERKGIIEILPHEPIDYAEELQLNQLPRKDKEFLEEIEAIYSKYMKPYSDKDFLEDLKLVELFMGLGKSLLS